MSWGPKGRTENWGNGKDTEPWSNEQCKGLDLGAHVPLSESLALESWKMCTISLCLSFPICQTEPVTLTSLGSGEESGGRGMPPHSTLSGYSRGFLCSTASEKGVPGRALSSASALVWGEGFSILPTVELGPPLLCCYWPGVSTLL